jgi:hypothetical protein
MVIQVNDDIDFKVPSCYLTKNRPLWKPAYISSVPIPSHHIQYIFIHTLVCVKMPIGCRDIIAD